jgi:hypothetical protein
MNIMQRIMKCLFTVGPVNYSCYSSKVPDRKVDRQTDIILCTETDRERRETERQTDRQDRRKEKRDRETEREE